MIFEVSEETTEGDINTIKSTLQEAGAFEVNEKDFDESEY